MVTLDRGLAHRGGCELRNDSILQSKNFSTIISSTSPNCSYGIK